MGISALWAKKSKEGHYWLPLSVHLIDTAEVAKRLWCKWLPEGVRQIIMASISGNNHEAKKLVMFLAAAHDIGKATPVFEAKISCFPATALDLDIYDKLLENGFQVKENRDKYDAYAKTHHAVASQLLLEKAKDLGLSDANLNKNAAVILGAHHGKPPDDGYSGVLGSHKSNFGRAVPAWHHAQAELIRLALECGGYRSLADVPCPSMPGQILLSGLIIMADWIASNEGKFPLVSLDVPPKINSDERARIGWEKLSLSERWDPYYTRSDEGLYAERFGFEPNDMQKAVLLAAGSLRKPGIMVIEAPMGTGKTEAALAAAEVFCNTAGCGGVFFALPTQATSDGIFPRLTQWMDKLDFEEKHSVNLAHGKAQFNSDFSKMRLFEGEAEVSGDNDEDGEESAVFVHQWFTGRKKTMLADFVAGTIDQLLLMALKQKHVMLRHLGLAGKVVIIDECHAYDAYMSQYLKMALRWLGAYGAPVIVLSATLPGDKRREVIGAYLGNEKISGDWAQSLAYPLITYTDGGEVKCRVVEPDGKNRVVAVERLAREKVADKLEDLLSGGGCAGVIMSTVRRAQEMARALRERFGADAVRLIHSRFIATDRMAKEEKLRDELGKRGKRPGKLIVVGTQVLEQSLDIDFDVMITDIAPVDLLLQRMGRLHRHDRSRPEKLRQPICFVTGIDGDGFESGIDSVYHKYLLMRTRDLLDGLGGAISLPGDITRLVNAAYDRNAERTKEKDDWEGETAEKVSLSKTFRMRAPSLNIRASIVNLLYTDTNVSNDPTGKKGEATVRDTDESIEVLIIKENYGRFALIDGKNLPSGELAGELAKTVATQSITLPPALCYPRMIDRVIKELEARTREHVSKWLESQWLSGELFLILDGNNSTNLCGYEITYTAEDGLVCVKEEDVERE